jgi:hypothetical protein
VDYQLANAGELADAVGGWVTPAQPLRISSWF